MAATPTESESFDWYTGAKQLNNVAAVGPVEKLRKWPAGKGEVEGPWVSMDAEILVSGGRSSSYSTSSGDSGYSGYSPLWASMAAGYSYGANILARNVTVTSSADLSYHKGADGQPVPNRSIGHGPGTGDSVASWAANEGGFGAGMSWKIDTTFTANHSFPQVPVGSVCSWEASGGTAFDSPTNEHYRVERRVDNAKSLPQSQSLKVTVTDAQEPVITATNSYGITWHLPYEPCGPMTFKLDGMQLGQVLQRFHTGDHTIPPENPEASGSGYFGAVDGGLEGGSYYSPDMSAAKEIAFQLSDAPRSFSWNPMPGATFHNDQDTWNLTVADPDQQNNFDPPYLRDQPSGWQGCDMEVWKMMRFKHNTWPADRYNGNGFESTGHKLFVNTDHKIRYEARYISNNLTSGGSGGSSSGGSGSSGSGSGSSSGGGSSSGSGSGSYGGGSYGGSGSSSGGSGSSSSGSGSSYPYQ